MSIHLHLMQGSLLEKHNFVLILGLLEYSHGYLTSYVGPKLASLQSRYLKNWNMNFTDVTLHVQPTSKFLQIIICIVLYVMPRLTLQSAHFTFVRPFQVQVEDNT